MCALARGVQGRFVHLVQHDAKHFAWGRASCAGTVSGVRFVGEEQTGSLADFGFLPLAPVLNVETVST